MIAQQVDIPRLNALSKYWAQHPPMHLLLAAHVGWKPPSEACAPDDEGDGWQQAQNFIPAATLDAAAFEALLVQRGLEPMDRP